MTDIFAFRSRVGEEPYRKRKVFFSAADSLSMTELFSELRRDVGEELLPSQILIIVRQDVHAAAKTVLVESFASTDDWRVDVTQTPIELVGFNLDGTLGSRFAASKPLELSQSTFDCILREGAAGLFKTRDGLLVAGEGQHFVYPSQKHSTVFIRTANLMVFGAEVMFLAACLLKYAPRALDRVWIDTSSIAPVAQALVALRRALDPKCTLATVDSFSSWEGINKPERLFPSPEGLVLISASTSGAMSDRLVQTLNFDPSQVVTLYSLEHDPSGARRILCHLMGDEEVERLARAALTYKDTDSCALCRSGSKPLRLVGDQFLADAMVRFSLVEIIRDDAPKWLRSFMENYHGYNAFGVGIAPEARAPSDIRIDPKPLFETTRFSARLEAACVRDITLRTTLLVSPEDDGSSELATLVKEQCQKSDASCPSPIPASSIPATVDAGGVVVAAAVISGGSTLDAISRDLRDPTGERPRSYIIGFAKHTHLPRHRQLLSNLRFNSKRAAGTGFEHIVRILEPLSVPDASEQTAWEAEVALIERLVEENETKPFMSDKTLASIEGRKETLLTSGPIRTADLFWKSPEGTQLELRDTFAFWSKSRPPSQGDVLFTVATVLEHLRSGDDAKLKASSFEQSIIDPGMFGRFNDGVVQAAFLRAARAAELAYNGVPAASAHMLKLLKRLFGSSPPMNEGAFEFLVAVACGRLRLTAEDTRQFVGVARQLPEPATAFIHWIEGRSVERLSDFRS